MACSLAQTASVNDIESIRLLHHQNRHWLIAEKNKGNFTVNYNIIAEKVFEYRQKGNKIKKLQNVKDDGPL